MQNLLLTYTLLYINHLIMRLTPYRVFFLLLILLFSLSAKGQEHEFDGCLNHQQLCLLHKENIQNMGQMMGKQRFFMVSSEYNVSFVWLSDTLTMDMYNWQFSMGFNDIYVNAFHKEGFYNFVEYNTTANCANKLLHECKEIYMDQYDEMNNDTAVSTGAMNEEYSFQNQESAHQLIFDYKEGYRFIFPEERISNDQFLIQVYNPSDFKRLSKLNKTQQEQEQLARQIKEQTIQRYMNAADSLAETGEFPAAIKLLEEVYDLLPDYIATVDTKLGIIKKQYKDKKIQDYTEEGKRLYDAGDYQQAMEMYDQVLKEDMNNQNALEQTKNIKKKLEVLHLRGSTTYEYKESNPQNHKDFCEILSNELNALIDNTPNGKLRMEYSILFDTLGVNQSFYNIQEFNTVAIDKNLPVFQSRMSNLLGHQTLQPSYSEGIPIRSASSLNLDIEWENISQTVTKTRKKIANKSSYPLHPMITEALYGDSMMYYGKYHMDIKHKTFNSNQLYDIKLTKYHTVGGEAFFYGLFPGLGTLIATQGKEGAACMVLSILCYGGAAASYILFDNYRKKFNNESESLSEKEASSLKTKREVCKWSSIAGFSIGGTIQFSGMIKALVRGVQNKKASKELRQALKNEPLELKKETIQIQ